MSKNFNECSYLSQVRRLRLFAKEALKLYPLGFYKLEFIHHGENCTFKVHTKKKNYLLRVHRFQNHTKAAIAEELKWLDHLNKKSEIKVQAPLKTKRGSLITEVHHPLVGKRFVSILTWQDGFIKYKKTEKDFYAVGSLLGRLQNNAIKSKHRQYWNAQGLMGKNATFGHIDIIKDDYKKAHQELSTLAKENFKTLKVYERSKDAKLGLMHADLHFGNMVWHKGGVTPIDFDDCGHGIQMYDPAIVLCNSSNFFKRIGKRQASLMKHSLLDGLDSQRTLLQKDIDIIPHLIRARDILMIAWLYQRRDNPQLKEHLDNELMNKVKKIKNFKNYQI